MGEGAVKERLNPETFERLKLWVWTKGAEPAEEEAEYRRSLR
jgi:hypothetical protein